MKILKTPVDGKVMKKKLKKNWIKGAVKHPGALHSALGVKQGTKIPAGRVAAAAERGGKVGREARLAQTLKGFHKSSPKKAKLSSKKR